MTATDTKDLTKKHPLPSGAVLHLGRPAFAACGALRNALARAAGERAFTPEEMKMGLGALKENPSAGGALVQRLLAVVASPEVENALFGCLVQATYQPAGQNEGVRLKVSRELFDHEQFGDGARADFYPICIKAGEAALGPFLGALVSAYKEFQRAGSIASPAPKST